MFAAPWPAERTAQLKVLWEANKTSASGIAALLNAAEPGLELTRNAIIGKVNRLRLTPHKLLPLNNHYRPRKAGKQTPARLTPRALRLGGGSALIDADTPMEQRKTILQLDRHTCRWPIGEPKDPGFAYCGGVAVGGLPYCETHCRRAFIVR